MRILTHRANSAKVLYDFTQLASLSDDKNRLVFMSQRDMSIIFSSIEFADRVQTRVFTSVENEQYVIVEDDQFFTFANFINSIRVSLGEWPMSNEYLERIAISLESIDTKSVERITWQEMIDDLETTLGVGNAFVEIIKWVGNLFPQVRLKLDFTALIMSIWEYFSWKAPILALLTTISASLAATAAAQIAEKPLLVLRTVLDAFNSALNVNNSIRDFILGDWNWYDDILKPLWDQFISDGEGGEGGADPDNDADLRPIVNVTNALTTTLIEQDVFSCSPDLTVNCGGTGSTITGDNLGSPGTGSLIDIPDPVYPTGDPATDPPPEGFESWAAFNEYRCNAANALFDACLGWFRFLGGLEAAGFGATAGAVFGTWLLAQIGAMMAAAAATTVIGGFAVTTTLAAAFTVGFLASAPAWVLGLIVAAIAALTATVGIGFLVVFDALADDFEAKRDDVVCQLFVATDITAARAALATALEDSLDSFVIGAPYNTWEAQIRVLGQTIVGYMLPNSFLQQLWTRSEVVDAYTAAQATCEDCQCDPILLYDFLTTAQGWAWASASCDSVPSKAGSSAAWSSSQGGSLRLSKSAGGDHYVNVGISSLDGLIESGHRLSVTGYAAGAAAFIRTQIITTESGCLHIGSQSINANAAATLHVDLSPWIGETITGFTFGAGNSAGQAVDFYLQSWGVTCVA